MAQLASVTTRLPLGRLPGSRRLRRSSRSGRTASLSRRSSVTFGNGVVQAFTYDPITRLATQTTDLAATANDLTQTFAYTPASQIASVTRSNDVYAWTGHFNQNDGSTANGLNQIGNAGAKTISHDSKGNITAVGTDTYGYTSENFLTSGPASASLSYDPMGRLVQVAQGAATTRLGYDGLDRIAEYDAANAVLSRYIHGPGVDNPITWYEGSGTTTRKFLSADERGSIIALTDSAGALLGINKYDEYGVPQSTNLGKFGYTGQAWVPEVGLWYYKARAYRPDIGRFMQTDPVSSTNLYAYVGNDPVNLNDPLGLVCSNWMREIWDPGSGWGRGPPNTTEYFVRCDAFAPPNLDGGRGNGESGGDRNGDGDEDAIVVTGTRRQYDDLFFQAAQKTFIGVSFCPNARWGGRDFFNPFGRINSGKAGGFNTAISDIDRIAVANRLFPLGSVPAIDVYSRSWAPLPIPIGRGWYASSNYVSGYTNFTNRGLNFRVHPSDGEIRMDLAAGTTLPDGRQLDYNETCHYGF